MRFHLKKKNSIDVFIFFPRRMLFICKCNLFQFIIFNQKILIYPSPVTYTLRACFVMNADLANLA